MQRTRAGTMFLISLDEKISKEVLLTLYESNIRVVTTKHNKIRNYKDQNIVISFENLIAICKENNEKWKEFKYTEIQKNEILQVLRKQIEKHSEKKFIKKHYNKRINELEKE